MSTAPLLEIKDLFVKVAEKEVLKGLSLTIQAGEVHVVLGQNGIGKSTLAYAVMGHPNYTIQSGSVKFQGEDLLALEPGERARKGVFLAFQNPISVPGVSVANFLRTAYQARFHGGVVKATEKDGGKSSGFSVMEFQKKLIAAMKELKIDPTLATWQRSGLGCDAGSGLLRLEALDPPAIDTTCRLELQNTLASFVALPLAWAGFDDVAWGGVPLPFTLDALGAPGCSLYTGVEVPIPMLPLGTRATGSIALPDVSAALGLRLHFQGAVWNFANGVVATSDLLTATVGPQ